MAFIYEADRKPLYNPALAPGPGQYFSDENSRFSNRGFAPFLSTVERGIGNGKKTSTKPELPGPGAYDPGLSISNSLRPNKTFHATLLPEKEATQSTSNSTVFKSKTRRFEHKIDTELPGPGAYYKDRTFEKAATMTHLNSKSPNTFDIKQLIKDNKANIPSIPSYVHSYGYSEDDKKLQLNKNPLIEIQQFVGPGYYDAKEQFTPQSNKGTTWYKSGSKRFNPSSSKASNAKVGPGSYDVKSVEGAQPLYKTVKPSPAFEDTSERTFLNKTKPKSSPRGNEKITFEIGLAKPDTVVDNNYARHRPIDENGPGPGYYHNENYSSSLKLSYKPTKLQFFGSGSDRWKENTLADQNLGPGEYNVEAKGGKKSKIKAAFLSNEPKMKDDKTNGLGPGVYELNTALVDRVKDKAKRGYLGSFGSTELRFKPTKPEIEASIPEKVELFKTAPPHPKPQRMVEEPKNTHVFTSKTEKVFANTKHENPPPGAYEVHYYDIAKKVIDGVNPLYNAKKAPFNTSDTRLKYRDSSNGRNQEDRHMVDDHMERKRATSFKPAVKSAGGSVFASKTIRGFNTEEKAVPGPGSYQGTVSQDAWNKKTFNIKYLEERGVNK